MAGEKTEKTEGKPEEGKSNKEELSNVMLDSIKDMLPDGKLVESEGSKPLDMSDEPKEGEGEPKGEPKAEGEGEPKAEGKPEGEGEPKVEPKAEGEGEPKAEGKPEGEGEPKVEPKADAKPSDEFGDLPEDANEKTKERFDTMKGKYDEVHADLETLRGETQGLTAFAQEIKDTGTDENQFKVVKEYLTAVNSGKPEGLQRAYDFMQEELKVLGKMLGKEAPDFDPLDAHADLKEEFDSGGLSRERALEIAAARSATVLNTARTTAVDDDQAAQIEYNNGIEALKVVGAKLRAKDPLYEQKLPQLRAAMDAVISSGAPPKNWALSIEAAYPNIKIEAPTPAATIVPDTVRPGTTPPGSKMHKQAGSALEAAKLAVAGMAR